MESDKWKEIVDILDYAFQPIVNINTGVCIGHEALLRNFEDAGFSSIQEIFDVAYDEKALFKLDLLLRKKAVEKFVTIQNYRNIRLFFNLDNRVLDMPDYSPGNTSDILKSENLLPDMICFEISERHELHFVPDVRTILNKYKRQLYKIAIDDFGAGYSGLQLLYHSEPDYIKIDRFFISSIETDSKKKLFVAKVLNLAHILGITVIAEGVETEQEFYFCKEIGCDYLQGYFVQKPMIDIDELKNKYEKIAFLHDKERRNKTLDRILLQDQMVYMEPLHLYNRDNNYFTEMSAVFESFRKNKNMFFPVINSYLEPIGLIREMELKEYVYSKYGKDLLLNKAYGKTLIDFVVKCPILEINTKIEKILEYFAIDEMSEGIILTENAKYIGFLSVRSLLKVVNEKNVKLARDQNPLTKLPGNTMINDFIEEAIEDTSSNYVMVYFDFNSFKPFNDRYGFRQGDRAILLFSDILKKVSSASGFFVGHVGGDDFFAGFNVNNDEIGQIHEKVKYIIEKFRDDALSLHDQSDREKGYIISTDREGNKKRFPLLCVSAAILDIPAGERNTSLEEIGESLANLKKLAKHSIYKIASTPINGIKNLCTKSIANPEHSFSLLSQDRYL